MKLHLSCGLRAESQTQVIPSSEPPTGTAAPSGVGHCDLRHIATGVLSTSHCVPKLGGQVAFAQQSNHRFFGTNVQSHHELRFCCVPSGTFCPWRPLRSRRWDATHSPGRAQYAVTHVGTAAGRSHHHQDGVELSAGQRGRRSAPVPCRRRGGVDVQSGLRHRGQRFGSTPRR